LRRKAGAGLLGTVWLRPGAEYEAGDELVVEATLFVVGHEEEVTPAGEKFEGFIELRLSDVQVVVD
jgi:hypothetical protein